LAFEFHRPEGSMGEKGTVFHRVQAQVYRALMDGANVILSAPTSFGKSLIIDAIIDSARHKRIVLVVPTIALIDETRKRLARFNDRYKIITHASQMPEQGERGAIYVLTQERVIDRSCGWGRRSGGDSQPRALQAHQDGQAVLPPWAEHQDGPSGFPRKL
jgi:replicative superfamily II helicase